jgi:type II secretory pathway pseudopilin PulG
MQEEDHTSKGNEDPNRPPVGRSPQFRFNLRLVLTATLVICVLLLVLLPLFRRMRQLAQQDECVSNLKAIANALHNYYDVYKKFPWAITYGKDGTPMHSWRVRVLPYIASSALYAAYDFDEPWNGPKNGLLGDEVPDTWLDLDGTVLRDQNGTLYEAVYFPPAYRCPSAPTSQNQMCTNYVMLIDDRPGKPNGPPKLPGSVPPSRDPGSTVIVIEIADSDIHWMEPRDVLLSELSMKINDRSKRSLSSYHGGACIAHSNGMVEILDDATTEERVGELLTQKPGP